MNHERATVQEQHLKSLSHKQPPIPIALTLVSMDLSLLSTCNCSGPSNIVQPLGWDLSNCWLMFWKFTLFSQIQAKNSNSRVVVNNNKSSIHVLQRNTFTMNNRSRLRGAYKLPDVSLSSTTTYTAKQQKHNHPSIIHHNYKAKQRNT